MEKREKKTKSFRCCLNWFIYIKIQKTLKILIKNLKKNLEESWLMMTICLIRFSMFHQRCATAFHVLIQMTHLISSLTFHKKISINTAWKKTFLIHAVRHSKNKLNSFLKKPKENMILNVIMMPMLKNFKIRLIINIYMMKTFTLL